MKLKVISAIIMIALIIPILIIGSLPLYIGIGIIAVLAYKEIVTLKESHQKIPDLIKVIGAICLLLLVFVRFAGYYIITGVSYQSLAVLLVAMLTPTIFYKNNKYTTKDALYMIGSILLLGLIFNILILVYNMNKWYLVYLILITALNDSFAMLLGSLIGKHKLTPISPNKTIEGSLSGLILGTFISTLFFINVIDVPIKLGVVIIMTIILSIAGQIGDILFSKIKRENNIKDFSKIIPGHGGILDRIDSLAFALLVFAIIIKFI